MDLQEEIECLEVLEQRGFVTADELSVQRAALIQANADGTLTDDQLTAGALGELADSVEQGRLSRTEFESKKLALLWTESSDDAPAEEVVCGLCQRTFATSEILTFNRAVAKRAGLDFVCPACGDDPSRRRLLARASHFYIVSVPNDIELDRCVQSYVDHGWTVYARSDVVVHVKKKRREVAIEIAKVTHSVGEAALLALRRKV